MQTDVVGRVRNTSVAASRPLLPLYEALVNSIQAIQDAGEPDGRIMIEIVRSDAHLFKDADPLFGPIVEFAVTDNGIGFDLANFDAFETSDTTFKQSRGGKGVGRFLWLVAFQDVEVDSDFLEGDTMRHRHFEFVAEAGGIRNITVVESPSTKRSTTVRLKGFREKYQEQCPKRMETIGAHLLQHCLEYFILSDCPEIVMREQATGDELNLNNLFDKEIKTQSELDRVAVGDRDFNVLHVRLYSASVREPYLHYCADKRAVKSEKLLGKVPNLARRFSDEEGVEFVYAGYVDGRVLDETVNAERTDFSIPEDQTELLTEALTWKGIRDAVLVSCQAFLAPYTEPVRRRKIERVEKFVASQAPEYRSIVKYIPGDMDQIAPDISDDELDLALYRTYQAVDYEARREGQELLARVVPDEEWDDFQERFSVYYEKASDIHKSDLARYVCHRRTVIDFLQKQLTVDGGKYSREDRIHQIIFPQGKTSDDVRIDEHNLWVLDEKLVYHAFLASDKALTTARPLQSTSLKRPDIMVFGNPCAFVPEGDPPFPSVVVIEFKRPMKDDFSDDDNPIRQVIEYVRLIREGKVRTHEGRNIPFANEIPVFCYVVADFTASLVEQARYFDFDRKPGAEGFFGYHKQYNAYVEVLSYNQIVVDAKQRNAAFFRRLGIPDRID